MHRILASTLLLAATVSAFAPSAQHQQRQTPQHAVSKMPLQATKLAALPTIPNPFQSLPWNVEKAQKSQERKIKLERSKLHRELGIAQDATYEEIMEVVTEMIEDTSDRKRKIQIEVMKDKILQARLNERLAGLVSDIVSDDAKAQDDESNLEEEAIAELKDKKQPKEWNAPAWTQGLIVKPDQAHIKSQVQIWGIMSLMGLALPPFIQYANRFSWMVCVAQLSFRGMAKQEGGGGGFGVMRMGNGPGEKKHLKVAWLLGISITIVGAVVTYGLMPQWAKGHRLTPTLAFAMRNFIYGVACSYLQPYKG
uniref:Uncharacterized protein n=1 Tax=Pseudo-nitzschia australis TaxID=44445 RepID=A0A7S4AFN0_9STRA|mmetsp:Transcript_26428/g.55440  ORF Transcript_26428/g.55440 Transcript_26428/m.55440 type:complete len:309 (+) Transcript_26428:272-1198(+)